MKNNNQKNTPEQVADYLTKMKELSNEIAEPATPPSPISQTKPSQDIKTRKVPIPMQEKPEKEQKQNVSSSNSLFSSRDVILITINLLTLILLIVLLIKFPQKAKQLRDLRAE